MRQSMIPMKDRILFALDVADGEQARQWVHTLETHVGFYKVGLQLFLAEGFPIVDWIMSRGHKVMLDLKFFDVPETVKLAVAQVARYGATFTTIHGNDAIVRAAVEVKGNVKLLAVTVLTSFDESDLRAMGMTGSVEDLVARRAGRARDLQCDGVVASGLEAARLRRELGPDLLIVTPGIRPTPSDYATSPESRPDDQKRVMTARQAFLNGADHIVVGRPISRAQDPLAVVAAMQQEIHDVLG